MSLNTKGQKCEACSAYLFEEDDIVYCPVCGAPHHRDCYTALGRCALEEHHGTEHQYQKPITEKTREEITENPAENREAPEVCSSCGHTLSQEDKFCPRCGMPAEESPFGPMSPFARVVQIKDDTPVCDDVTAIEAAEIVRVNGFRYIPKFLQISKERKRSWNWAAFILPGGWFAYRKMYKESFVATAFMIMTMLCNIPFNLAIALLPAPGKEVTTYLQMGEYYAGYMSEIGIIPLVLAAVGLVGSLVLRIVCGIYGDYFYKNRITASARLIREAEDKDAAKKKYSGVSFIGFVVAVAAMEFIPSIIAIFLV